MKFLTVLLLTALPAVLAFSSCPHGDYNEQAQYVCRCFDDEKSPTAECTNSNIDSVPPDLSPYLHGLDLSFNRIQSISDMGMYDSLETFKITHNNLSAIKQNCFQENRDLTVLDLSHNVIDEIEVGMFTGLSSLVVLDLSANKINQIQEDSFRDLTSITTLDLSHNYLKQLDTKVFVGGVSSSLDGFTSSLSNLNLAHNYLKIFPTEALSKLINLSWLDIGHNALSKLETPVFKNLKVLTYLSLRECGLFSLGDAVFSGLEVLETLDLSHNGLQEVPDKAFSRVPSLETLLIGGNRIMALGRSQLAGLGRLRSFSMDDCQGESLVLGEGVFSSNRELRSLNLGKCNIHRIDGSVSLHYLPMLRAVNLHANRLRTLPQSFLPTSDLDSLDVSGCPLDCGCSLLWFKNLLQHNPDLSRDASCEYAGEYKRVLITEEEAFSCEPGPSVGLIVGSVVSAVVALIIIAGLVVVLMKRPGLCTSCAGTGYAKITSFSLIPSTRRRRKKRNRLSANYTGKEDIQVLQNDIENNGRFIELSGLQQGGDRRQPIYEEVADALQGGPGPDVKISEL